MAFFKRKTEVLNHWIGFADGFQISPTEFYSALEKELTARSVPKMQMDRIEFPEGGLLSEKRIYLRMLRERLVFDVCAAPFGTGCFFSCRTSEIPIVVKLWQIMALLAILGVFALPLYTNFGLVRGIGLFLIALIVAGTFARNVVGMGLNNLDQTLVQSPLTGSIYSLLFRKETYHRIDSRLCYLHLVRKVVQELAEETLGEKGVRLVDQYEASPILGDLYKPSRQRTQDADARETTLPSASRTVSI